MSTYSAVWNHGDVPKFLIVRFLIVGLLCSVLCLAQWPLYTDLRKDGNCHGGKELTTCKTTP